MGYDLDNSTIIVSFRGTIDLINWIADFDFFKEKYIRPGCESCFVHQGFFYTYDHYLRENMMSYIQVLTSIYP